ncbi:MAG: hypothetical protein AABY15_00735 [Nanoarchaeota archaeon]
MVEKKGNSEAMGIAGFTLGIVSLALIIFGSPFGGIIFGVVGGVLCYRQQKKKPMKMAKTGLILNIVGVVLNIILIVVYVQYIIPLLAQYGA